MWAPWQNEETVAPSPVLAHARRHSVHLCRSGFGHFGDVQYVGNVVHCMFFSINPLWSFGGVLILVTMRSLWSWRLGSSILWAPWSGAKGAKGAKERRERRDRDQVSAVVVHVRGHDHHLGRGVLITFGDVRYMAIVHFVFSIASPLYISRGVLIFVTQRSLGLATRFLHTSCSLGVCGARSLVHLAPLLPRSEFPPGPRRHRALPDDAR